MNFILFLCEWDRLVDTLFNKMSLLWAEVGLLIASISVAGVGIIKNQRWSKNAWLIPVLVALMWGVLQDG